ncbi:Immunoglobulin lambda-1 light chain [Anabarilius grahami]|nr:Immunoglobulin lambda-1 light chain [Anabarilius grahami]
MLIIFSFTLLTLLSSVRCVKVVTQKPSVLTEQKGNTVTMYCNIEKDEGYHVSWYKQTPNSAPQFVLRFYQSHGSPDYYGDGFTSSRFTSTAQAKIDYRLIINNVDVGDSAVYYCHTWDSSVRDLLWLVSDRSALFSRLTSHTHIMLSVFIILFFTLSCVSGVTVVTQSPLITVNKGQTATLDCNLGIVNSAARWYKQTPGGVPQFVLVFNHDWSSVKYGSGFSAPKFTSTHSSKSDYSLIINNVDVGDSAVYYCQTYDGSVNFPLAPPVVTLLSPSTEALKESKATLVCLAEDISVALVHVSWTVNGRSVTDGVWSSATEKQQDKTFKMSSYLTIDSSDWINDVDFSCQVSVGSKFTKKRISNSQCY